MTEKRIVPTPLPDPVEPEIISYDDGRYTTFLLCVFIVLSIILIAVLVSEMIH